MTFTINGQDREFPELRAGATLDALIDALALKGDRVAVEHNGNIVSRPDWPATTLESGDKFEIVHFVGGGSGHPDSNPL
jgi:thiamine biosynthesis protein ThiS